MQKIIPNSNMKIMKLVIDKEALKNNRTSVSSRRLLHYCLRILQLLSERGINK